nr:hypothetical protein [Cereibacter sphaeroides]
MARSVAAPARRRDELGVQPARDLLRRDAGGVVPEDPADDGGLGLVDLQFPGDGLTLFVQPVTVAVGAAAGAMAARHTRPQPALRLEGEVLQESLRHRRGEADPERVEEPAVQREELHLVVARHLVEPRRVFLIPRQSVEALEHHYVAAPGAQIIQHLPVARAIFPTSG